MICNGPGRACARQQHRLEVAVKDLAMLFVPGYFVNPWTGTRLRARSKRGGGGEIMKRERSAKSTIDISLY